MPLGLRDAVLFHKPSFLGTDGFATDGADTGLGLPEEHDRLHVKV
jgi:hypothetical protein